jgi:hypothetical protein
VLFLNEEAERFRKEIYNVGYRLTLIMDRMKKTLENNPTAIDESTLKCLRSAQDRLLQAYRSFYSSYKAPPDLVESWDHYLAKNEMINRLNPSIDPSDVFPEIQFGGARFDAVIKNDRETVIVETETDPSKCVKDMVKIKRAVNLLNSGELDYSIEALDDADTKKLFAEIKRQVQARKPLRVTFAVTRDPKRSTLENIMNEANSLVSPEVHYVNPKPNDKGSFEISRDLLQNIRPAEDSASI